MNHLHSGKERRMKKATTANFGSSRIMLLHAVDVSYGFENKRYECSLICATGLNASSGSVKHRGVYYDSSFNANLTPISS